MDNVYPPEVTRTRVSFCAHFLIIFTSMKHTWTQEIPTSAHNSMTKRKVHSSSLYRCFSVRETVSSAVQDSLLLFSEFS